MADITYTVNQDDPNNIPGFENYSQADLNLIQQYQINSLFDTNKHFIELNITDLAGNIIENDNNYIQYKLLGTAQSAGKEGASILTIDPIEDSKTYGYDNGGIKLLYHFLNDLYTLNKTTTQFYISAISPDRTELQLQNLNLTNEQIVEFTTTIKDRLSAQSYFSEFRLNFGNNDLLIGINIDNLLVGQNQTVVVKLYEPLPTIYSEKSTLAIVETVSDSVAFEVDTIYQFPEEVTNTIRSANFNLEITDNQVIPTSYLTYNDLFSYPVNNTNNQLYSIVNEKGAELSIDHTDYANFVHFSSAYERLVNFKYKLQLIESYSSSLALVQGITSQSIGLTGSVNYFENLITGVVSNFDHYERFLYYESSSYAWPKSNTTQPYINISSSNAIATTWYANQLTTANGYDLSNGSILINSIPTFLRDDPNNENYLTFIYMIGQHFDNLWLYGKAVTDKYDADNRLDFGISKDLVGEALKNFGVKLYTSNNSIEDLFGSFIGQAYQSGSEDINFYITGSLTGSNTPIQPSSYDNYNKEVQKRIYHNLSHLVKTKGTERGLRALINCFGIPSDILKIKLYGGRNVDERPFYGDFQYYTSSLGKVRLDHTGSLITGSTLSSYTSIYKRDPKYTDDLHTIEVGFSPTDNVDNYIVSYSLATGSLSSFNIDDYIGDPRNLTLDSYALLNSTGGVVDTLTNLTNSIMSSSDAYDVFDYVRLIKFFDNTIFKMVRDFIPARVTADTGIIIKPHLLQRNKAKSVLLLGSRTELSGSINTAFIESSNGDTFGGVEDYITAYTDIIQTPTGLVSTEFIHNQEQPKYNGEFSGSTLIPTNGNLSANNQYLVTTAATYNFGTIQYVSSSDSVCVLAPIGQIQYITSSTQEFQANEFFNVGTVASGLYNYSASNNTTSPVYNTITFPHTFNNYSTYTDFYLVALSTTQAQCSETIQLTFGTCSLNTTSNAIPFVRQYNPPTDPQEYNLTLWFNPHPDQTNLQYTASWSDGVTNYEVGITDPTQYAFTQANGTSITITIKDPNLGEVCKNTYTTTVGSLGLGISSTRPAGDEFIYSEYTRANIFQGRQCNTTDELTTQPCRDRIYRFLGEPPTATANIPSVNQGIPGYFYNLSQGISPGLPSTIPGGGPSIRYRVYEVKGLGISSTDPNTPKYGVRLHGSDPFNVEPTTARTQYYSPCAIDLSPNKWLKYENEIRYCNNQMIRYATRWEAIPPYSNPIGTNNTYVEYVRQALEYLDNLETNPATPEPTDPNVLSALISLQTGTWPVTVYTDFINNQTNTSIVNNNPSSLVRAYLIQAYNPDITPNTQYFDIQLQHTVYGEKSKLTAVEGSGNTPNFVTEYLKVGWNYPGNGFPIEQVVGGIGAITNEPSSITPGDVWVKFPRRYFT